MPTNQFLPFATGVGANVLSPAAYAASPYLGPGQQPGIASSSLNNTALRQGTYIASCLAQFIANVTGNNVLDDGNVANVLATLNAAFKTSPTITQYLSGSGTYTPPANVSWLRVRMVGGGGGGSGTSLDGGTGGTTTFGTALLSCTGGQASLFGTASLGAAVGLALNGGQGAAPLTGTTGGQGGSSLFGQGGAGSPGGSFGVGPVTNSGAGGGGGVPGDGGGAGGYVDAIISAALLLANPTFAYAVGAGGAKGASATFGFAGAAGQILIEEHY